MAKCAAVAPFATSCVKEYGLSLATAGRCEAWEQNARRRTALDPTNGGAWLDLARALAAQGVPASAVGESLEKKIALEPAATQAYTREWLTAKLALHDGDLKKARAIMEARVKASEKDEDLEDYSAPRMMLVDICEQIGDVACVTKVAKEARSHVAGRSTNSMTNRGNRHMVDLTLARALWKVGKLSAADLADVERRAVESMSENSTLDPYAGWKARVDGATTREAAQKLWQAWPNHVDVAENATRDVELAMNVGTLLLNAGEPKAAVPYLRVAAQHCFIAFQSPLAALRIQVHLAKAQAASGELEEARRGVQKLMQRWRNKPIQPTIFKELPKAAFVPPKSIEI